jgi:hypothetical protein
MVSILTLILWEDLQYENLSNDKGTGHVAHTLRMEMQIGIWWGRLNIRDHLEELGLDGR